MSASWEFVGSWTKDIHGKHYQGPEFPYCPNSYLLHWVGHHLYRCRPPSLCLENKFLKPLERQRSPKRRVRDDDFMVGISSNRLYIGGSTSRICRWNLECRISWQAQYLVKLEGGFSCSGHCQWRCTCEEEQLWQSCFVAGAVFGEVGGWLFLLRALSMTLHMWRGATMTVIFRGRGSIWWNWRVTPVCSAHCKWRFIYEENQL